MQSQPWKIEGESNKTIKDDDFSVLLDTGDLDEERTAKRTLPSKKLHYLFAQFVKESARFVVQQSVDSNAGSNRFETWRRLYNRLALPFATRHQSNFVVDTAVGL